jgi:ABC-2 type transport system permease protein
MLLAFFDNVDRMLVSIPRDDPDGEGGGQARAWNPVSVTVQEVRAQRRGPKNPFEVTFAQAIVWSVMGSAAGFAIGLGEERARGTMLRLRVSPLSWAQLLGGKAMACFVATLGVAVLILVLGLLPPFRVSVGSWPMLTVALLSVAVGFVGMMMLLAVIGRASGSGQMGWAVMLVLAVIGGGMVPLFVMPGFMQTLSVISPVRWAILAIEGGIWRGYSAAEMALPAGVLLGLGVAGFAVGAWMFSRGEE